MKKQEAEALAIDKSRVMIEYLEQILSDDNISGNMIFSSNKIDGEKEKMCTVDIMLNNGKARHLKLGIPSIHSDVFTKQFTSDLVDRFAKDDTMGVSQFSEIKSMPPTSRRGMDAISINEESYIVIEFPSGISLSSSNGWNTNLEGNFYNFIYVDENEVNE